MGKKWTDEEDEYLRNNAEYGNYQEIANYLDRSYSSVKSRARRLDIHTRIKWTEENLEYVKSSYPSKSDEEIAEHLGCTERAVKVKRQEIGMVNNHLWSQKEEEFIQNNWQEMSDQELSNKLNRSKNAIRNRRVRQLNISRPDSHSGKFNQGKQWTEERVEYLKDKHKSMSYKEIAEHLEISYQAVKDKASRLDLEKDYLWKDWEKKCEELAKDRYDNVKCQKTMSKHYIPDIYVPEKNLVIEAKLSYYPKWDPEKYLELEQVEKVVVWSYHKCPNINRDVPVYNRKDIARKLSLESVNMEV